MTALQKHPIHATRNPQHKRQPVRITGRHYNSIRANISAAEVYRNVGCHAKKLQAAYNALPREKQDTLHTCYACAVRSKCRAYNPYRTEPCTSKVDPLPPVPIR